MNVHLSFSRTSLYYERARCSMRRKGYDSWASVKTFEVFYACVWRDALRSKIAKVSWAVHRVARRINHAPSAVNKTAPPITNSAMPYDAFIQNSSG